jgi:hypothetical protein
MVGSLAATPLAQSKGSDADRTANDAAVQKRENTADERADAAAGIGETTEDSHAEDRDADGRRPWEFGAQQKAKDAASAVDDLSLTVKSKDPTGQAGRRLDLTG